MRALLRATVSVAVLLPVALLIAGSALAVTITTAGNQNGNNVEGTATDDPYCSGTMVLIRGTGFVYDSATPDPVKGAVTSVTIGNVPALNVRVGSDNTLYAQVGVGATTGPIVVTTPQGSASTASLPGGRLGTGTSTASLKPDYQIIPCVSKPTITKAAVTGFRPNPVKGGKKVQINGSGFSGVTKVTIGGKDAVFAVATNQNLIAIVPASAANGKLPVVITNAAGTITSTVKLVKKA